MRRFLGRLRARVKAYLRPEPYRIRPGQHQVPSEVTPLTDDEQAIVDAFHKLYYDQRVKNRETVLLSWYGHRIEKCPFDIWTYQEIIFDTKPDLIVECGTRFGGGALYLASLLDLRGGPGQVVTIDITPMRHQPKHPRIEYIVGSSSDPAVFARVKAQAAGKRTMVILDSDHSAKQVAAELKLWPEIVTPGCYLIIDDADQGGHPVIPEFGPGPTEALDEWYPTQKEFVIDPSRERFMLSLNPRGYLKRVS
jgi:cephalosporin hydroxylase